MEKLIEYMRQQPRQHIVPFWGRITPQGEIQIGQIDGDNQNEEPYPLGRAYLDSDGGLVVNIRTKIAA